MLSKLKGQVNKARCFNHFFTKETKLRCGFLSVFNSRLPMNISFKMNFLKRFICTCLNCGSLHFASCKQQLGPFTLCLYVNLLMLRKVVRREGGGGGELVQYHRCDSPKMEWCYRTLLTLIWMIVLNLKVFLILIMTFFHCKIVYMLRKIYTSSILKQELIYVSIWH